MILLMMVDTPEEKRKFVILYENYRYLITITKHAAIDLYRRRNRLQSREIYMDELPEENG